MKKFISVLLCTLVGCLAAVRPSALGVCLDSADTAAILSRFRSDDASSAPQTGILTGADTGDPNTYTGYEPLPEIHYAAADADNAAGLSRKTIEHSYGVAKDGKVHSISAESQRYFDEHGLAAVTYDRQAFETADKTGNKPLYLTFDCGYENGNTAKILDVLKEKGVPAAFFCTLFQVKSQPELTARMIREGHIVGNHSCSHPNFSTLTGEEIAQELEGFDNFMRTQFGYCAPCFRFPEGAYSEYALSEVASHGFTSYFWSLAYADWDENNQKGGDYAYETVISRLHPGAILLLHAVSSDNADAMARIIDEARRLGYTFASLTDL